MYRFDAFSRMGRAGVLAVAAALTISTGACSDDATAPQVTETPLFAKGGGTQTASKKPQVVTVQVVDIGWNNITELPTVRFFTDTDTIDVVDNSLKDKDATPGAFKVTLGPSGTYSACIIGETANYMAVPGDPLKPICGSAPAGNGDPMSLLFGYMRKKPKVLLKTVDWQNNLLFGATLELKLNGNTWTVTDGDGVWDNPAGADGSFVLTFREEGTLDVCEIVPPAGYVPVYPCFQLPLYWDGQNTGAIYHDEAPTSAPRS